MSINNLSDILPDKLSEDNIVHDYNRKKSTVTRINKDRRYYKNYDYNRKQFDISRIRRNLESYKEDLLQSDKYKIIILEEIHKKYKDIFKVSDDFKKDFLDSLLDVCPYKSNENAGMIFRDRFIKKIARYMSLMRKNDVEKLVIFSKDRGLTHYFSHELEEEFNFTDSNKSNEIYKSFYLEFSIFLLNYKVVNKDAYSIGRYGTINLSLSGEIYLALGNK